MSIGLTKAFLNFETKEEIGQEGKNSNVYIAHDKQLNAEIVIKKIKKEKMPHALAFFEEARQLYDSSHTNVVQIKYACEIEDCDDDGKDNGFVYIAMPYYKNGSLKKLMDSRFLTAREIIRYSIQFLSGLHNIHTKGLIHFDLKPDNILLSDSNEALVSDFGLTKAMDAVGMSAPAFIYNKHLPPEVFSQTTFSNAYDIYTAGLTLYRFCNGNKNFTNQRQAFKTREEYRDAVTKGLFPNRKFYLPHIPKELRKVINKALEVDQEKRYSSVLDFLNDLSKIESSLDWQYSEESGQNIWQFDDGDKIMTILLVKKATGFDISTTKTMNHSGVTTNFSQGSFKNVQQSKVDETINKLIMSLS